jgi:PKD repeat protein
VTLVVRSADGESIETKENFINVFSPLAADFTVDVTSGLTPLTVQFTDASSIGAGPVLSRTWSFGDGNTSSETNPQHTYVTPGTYSVELTVTTPDGTVTETKADLIEAIEPIAPSAEFSATPTAGPAPLDVAFTNESDPGTGADIGYTWDFGDGNMSTEESPAHTYNLLGTYTVGLEVVSSVGTSSETKVDYIQAQTPTLTSGGDAADRLRAIVVAADDSFAVAGDTRSFGGGETQPYFVRYGADGNLISEHAYTAQGNARAIDLVGTPDGGFVLVGDVETAENGLDVLAVKVDSNGNEVWRNVIGVAANDRGTAVVRTAGGFLIAGNTDRNGNQDILLVRLDGEGNLLWTEVYGGASFDLANDVIEVSNSFWIVGSTGRNAGAGSDVLLLRVGLGGAFISDVTYGTPQEDRGNALLFFEDELVIAGATGSGAGASDAWVIRAAAGPVPTWTRTLGGDGEEEAFDLVALADGDLVIAGSTTSDGNGLFDVFLARITSNGDEVWTEKLGDTGSEIAFGLGLISGDILLPAGQSDSFGSGSLDALVLKAGADGGQLQFP